jgi:hypothetical protein
MSCYGWGIIKVFEREIGSKKCNAVKSTFNFKKAIVVLLVNVYHECVLNPKIHGNFT